MIQFIDSFASVGRAGAGAAPARGTALPGGLQRELGLGRREGHEPPAGHAAARDGAHLCVF